MSSLMKQRFNGKTSVGTPSTSVTGRSRGGGDSEESDSASFLGHTKWVSEETSSEMDEVALLDTILDFVNFPRESRMQFKSFVANADELNLLDRGDLANILRGCRLEKTKMLLMSSKLLHVKDFILNGGDLSKKPSFGAIKRFNDYAKAYFEADIRRPAPAATTPRPSTPSTVTVATSDKKELFRSRTFERFVVGNEEDDLGSVQKQMEPDKKYVNSSDEDEDDWCKKSSRHHYRHDGDSTSMSCGREKLQQKDSEQSRYYEDDGSDGGSVKTTAAKYETLCLRRTGRRRPDTDLIKEVQAFARVEIFSYLKFPADMHLARGEDPYKDVKAEFASAMSDEEFNAEWEELLKRKVREAINTRRANCKNLVKNALKGLYRPSRDSKKDLPKHFLMPTAESLKRIKKGRKDFTAHAFFQEKIVSVVSRKDAFKLAASSRRLSEVVSVSDEQLAYLITGEIWGEVIEDDTLIKPNWTNFRSGSKRNSGLTYEGAKEFDRLFDFVEKDREKHSLKFDKRFAEYMATESKNRSKKRNVEAAAMDRIKIRVKKPGKRNPK